MYQLVASRGCCQIRGAPCEIYDLRILALMCRAVRGRGRCILLCG